MDEKKPARAAAVIFAIFAILFAGELVVAERFKAIFESMNVDLPIMTVLALDAGDFFVNEWYLAAPAYAGLVVASVLALSRLPGNLENTARLFVLGLGIGLVVVVPLSVFLPIHHFRRNSQQTLEAK